MKKDISDPRVKGYIAAWGCFLVTAMFAIWGLVVIGGILIKLTKWALNL